MSRKRIDAYYRIRRSPLHDWEIALWNEKKGFLVVDKTDGDGLKDFELHGIDENPIDAVPASEGGGNSLIIGLTREDMILLQSRHPRYLNCTSVRPDLTVILMYGRSDEQMQEAMKNHPEAVYKIIP